MKLIIVESPTKAKTIQKFVGKGFKVESSFGHIRDLPKSKIGVDVENDFAANYEIPAKAKKTVADLKKLAAKASTVVLATDADREGEAIAWHLLHALDLEKKDTERIVFHEITKEAIATALEHPGKLDLRLVDAQQARRILDRLVGYELSPLLWRKIYYGLSAGRVQSVAVRIIVEREREIQAFKAEEYWTIEAVFLTATDVRVEAKLHSKNGETLDKFAIRTTEDGEKLVAALKQAQYRVADVKQRRTKKSPLPPFTTSLLQQEASRRLSMSPKQTMMLAQQLYEHGFITYMRTDSMNLSEKFLNEAKQFLTTTYGDAYAATAPRTYKSKSKNAQEAHEAIRPTEVAQTPALMKATLDPKQYKVYDLIWRRAVASQMPEAEIETTTIDIETTANVQDASWIFRAAGSIIAFDGWRKLYPDDQNEQLLPVVTVGEAMKLGEDSPYGKQHFTEPPARYSEATLIKALEEHGIGRPSTYAPTVSTVVDRGYVERVERQLKPTELAFLVNDLLVEHFPKIVDFEFTAQMEEQLDDIAEGTKEMVPVLQAFYKPFHENLVEKDAELKKSDVAQQPTDQICEKCGKPMVIKFGRFGKFMACSGYPECKNSKPMPGSEEAQGTNEICELCGKPMQVKRGRFGVFLGCTGYPDCKGIKKIEKKTGVTCPKCEKGEIVEKRSKKGRNFFACNRYPDCEFSLWSKPTGDKCPKCQSLLLFAAKGIIKCSSKECDYTKEQEDEA